MYPTIKQICCWFIYFAEEIFELPEAIWPSDDGRRLVYASFNDTNVGMMTYPWFATGSVMAASGHGASSFPETRSVRYPTPGSTNPDVHLWVIDLTNVSDILRWHVTPPVSLDGQYVFWSVMVVGVGFCVYLYYYLFAENIMWLH